MSQQAEEAPMKWFRQGVFAPVTEEVTAFDLAVTGRIPSELNGRYLRNGPNFMRGIDDNKNHWFLGSGMVHGVGLRVEVTKVGLSRLREAVPLAIHIQRRLFGETGGPERALRKTLLDVSGNMPEESPPA